MRTSPTQRSKKMLTDAGFLVAVTERWNPFAKIRQDLFGFIDILAIADNQTLAVQTTSGANVSNRIAKLKDLVGVRLWLSTPSRSLVVHGWARRGARGKRKLWGCRVVALWLHAGEVHSAEEV